EAEVVVLALGAGIDPAPLVPGEGALLVVAGHDVLPQLRPDRLDPVSEVADHRKVAQDRVLLLGEVMDDDTTQGSRGESGHLAPRSACSWKFHDQGLVGETRSVESRDVLGTANWSMDADPGGPNRIHRPLDTPTVGTIHRGEPRAYAWGHRPRRWRHAGAPHAKRSTRSNCLDPGDPRRPPVRAGRGPVPGRSGGVVPGVAGFQPVHAPDRRPVAWALAATPAAGTPRLRRLRPRGHSAQTPRAARGASQPAGPSGAVVRPPRRS